jgi:hypothetical protein
VSTVPECGGDSDVAAEGRKLGSDMGTGDVVLVGGVPVEVILEEGIDAVGVGGSVGVGVGEN